MAPELQDDGDSFKSESLSTESPAPFVAKQKRAMSE